MSTPSESTYGSIQMEERYKKLERTLKHLLHQQKQNKPPAPAHLDPWRRENLDTSVGTSLHSSRIGSAVVSSSRDMRGMIHPQKSPENPQKMITSSVKQFPVKNPDERALMPPPRSIGILAHSSRRNSLANLRTAALINSAGTESLISSIKCSSSIKDTSQIEFEKENYQDFDENIKPDRIFSKWRPVLNEKGQLIIKGALECGKIARSKPVIQRLSSTSLLSSFKHIYHLNGNIHDERNELPDYIKGKFFNGFPDDWENVYQVWSNYVAGGCSSSFRWPTPITDSDDDLQSELTDFSLIKPRKRCNSTRLSSPRRRSRGRNEKLSPQDRLVAEDEVNFHQKGEMEISKNNNCCCARERANDTIQSFMDKMKNQQMNMSTTSSTPSSTRFSLMSLKDIIHEDKLVRILENLTSKNCPIEYIDKIIEMFDCMKYVVSFKPEEAGDESSSAREPMKRDTPYPFDDKQRIIEKSNAPALVDDTQMMKNSARRKLTGNDYESSNSDDLEEERRQEFRRREKRKSRRNYELNSKTSGHACHPELKLAGKIGKPVQNYDSSVSLTEDEHRAPGTRNYPKLGEKTPFSSNQSHEDSSVSITEDEINDRAARIVAQQIQINSKPKLTEANRNYQKEIIPQNLTKIDEIFLDNDKENQKNENVREEKAPENSSQEKKKKRPIVVNVEKVSLGVPLYRSSSAADAAENIQKSVIPALPETRKSLRIEQQDAVRDKEDEGAFGTLTNPKPLSSWCPKLQRRKTADGFGLVFEGKLLNEAGHIVSRKFSTGFILKRISPQIIEAEDHVFYKLMGEVSDVKRVLPKEVQRLCMKGCPGKINQFCERWRRAIERSPDRRESHNATLDEMSVPTSSRGRRILPPLNYWDGERLVVKNNVSIYNPGIYQESSVHSSLEASFKKDNSQSSSRKNTSAKDTSSSIKDITAVDKSGERNERKSLLKDEENVDEVKRIEEKKTRSKSSKRRMAREIKEDSSDAEADDDRKSKRRRRRNASKSPVKKLKKDEKESQNKLRAQDNGRTRDEGLKVQTSGLTCTYRKSVPYCDDVLSDDQPSLL